MHLLHWILRCAPGADGGVLTLSHCCFWLTGVIARETWRRERREKSESEGRREGTRAVTMSALVLASALPLA